MKKAKNMSKKLIAILLSAAMTFTPMLQSMPVYAAEVQTESETLGVMPEADEVDSTVSDAVSDDSDHGDEEEAAGEEQTPNDADADNMTEDDAVSDEDLKDNVSEVEKDDDIENVEEETETKPEETVSDPIYDEVMEEESESGSSSEEESESESEEMSLEENKIASFANVTESDVKAGGWNESIYAEISKVTDASAITEVSWTGTASGKLDEEGLKYLVRTIGGNGTRIDIPGLKAGTYNLSITVSGSGKLTKTGIEVYAYDRSGYARFNYTDGVGAYKEDGTLKNNAIVIYVTDENKNDVELTVGNTTVKGIGNILNSVGKECGEPGHEGQCKMTPGGKVAYGKANGNKGIIQKLSEADIPLVVRFVGVVSDSGLGKQGTFSAASPSLIDGLTAYNSVDYGGSVGDNGHMARMKSGKNITLEGIGYDATIDGWGFHFMCESANPQYGKSFEVRNLIFINTPEDAIGMEGVQSGGQITASVERCWIHNNEFYSPKITNPAESDKGEGDGSVDFKRGQYFTCSYNYFERCHKTNLVGSSDSSLQYNLTYHHNYWYLCKGRGPLTRQANVHMYNNFVDMQTDYAQNTRASAYIFSEYNMFYASKNPQLVADGAIKSYHDSIASYTNTANATVVEDKNQYVSNNNKYGRFDIDSSLSYIPEGNYQLEEDFTTLRKIIASQTGVQDRNPKRPENVSASEYSVVDRHGTTVTQVTPPQTLTPGKQNKQGYAFEVGGSFDIEITYSGDAGVLVNEAGENLLSGNGNVTNLPAGKYMVQAVNIQAGSSVNGTLASFKAVTIDTINITAHDPNAHYHKWVLDSSTDATCTQTGKKVYRCEGSGTCDENNVKEEEIPALGHDWKLKSTTATCTEAGNSVYECSRCGETKTESGTALGHDFQWVIDKAATATETGLKHEECTGCGIKQHEGTEIPKTEAPEEGALEIPSGKTITFEGGKPNGDTDFFTITGGAYDTLNAKNTQTINNIKYADSYHLSDKNASITFTCEAEAVLYIVCAKTQTSKSIKIDGNKIQTNGNAVLRQELEAGAHTITKDSQPNIVYISVVSETPDAGVYTLSFEYNYKGDEDGDEPEAKTIEVLGGRVYTSMETLANAASFTRTGYKLKGLYEDAACTTAVTYPYTVSGDDTFYAEWEEDNTPTEVSHTLFFDTDGGWNTSFAYVPLSISETAVYDMSETPKPEKAGYVFTGWYDAPQNGKLVGFVDGSKMTGNMTVYAYWLEKGGQQTASKLDCNTDLASYTDIKEKITVKGFTLHVLADEIKQGNTTTKYYMSMTNKGSDNTKKLGTNGVLMTTDSRDPFLRSIEFTAAKKGTLVVELELSGDGSGGTATSYGVTLGKKSSESSDTLTAINTQYLPNAENPKKQTMTFPLDEAGTYYLYPSGEKGVRYHSLTVTEESIGYTIIYQTGMGTAPDGLVPTVKAAGESLTLPQACIPAAGYTFKGWSVDGKNVLNGNYTVSDDDAEDGVITIMALYEADRYTIKFDANGGTLPQGAQNTTASAGEIIDLEAVGACTPPSGYEFKGWSVNDRTALSLYTVNGADADESGVITLTAVYEKVGTGDNTDPTGKKGIYIEGLQPTYDYTGDKITPAFDVVHYVPGMSEGKILTLGVDYTVTYKNNKDISTDDKMAEIIVKGKGNYAASKEAVAKAEFRIVAPVDADLTVANLIPVKGAKITPISGIPYDGEYHYPTIDLTLSDKTTQYTYTHNGTKYVLTSENDVPVNDTPMNVKIAVSNNKNKGTATIVVTGAEDEKTGKETKVKAKFKITPVKLTAANTTVETGSVLYTPGGAVLPANALTVKFDDGTTTKTLKSGKDYTVKYSNNKQAGDATVTVTGKGGYTGKASETFTIDRAPMSNFKVAGVVVHDGMATIGKIKKLTVYNVSDGSVLKPNQYTYKFYMDKDCTQEYDESDTVTAGMPLFVVAEANDFDNLLETGTKTAVEKIDVGMDIAKAKFKIAQEYKKGLDYEGKPVNLEAKHFESVTYKNEPDLNVSTDNGETGDYIIVSCSNNVNKGTATAVIKGINRYSGTKTIKYKIGQQTITGLLSEKAKSLWSGFTN